MKEAHPDWVFVSIDIKNTFNEVKRKAMLEKLWTVEALKPLWYYNWRECETKAPIILGSGPGAKVADFVSEEGTQQGDVKAMLNFCLGIDRPNKATLNDLANNGILNGFADDTLLAGPPEIVFPLLGKHKERLAEVRLELNLTSVALTKDTRPMNIIISEKKRVYQKG